MTSRDSSTPQTEPSSPEEADAYGDMPALKVPRAPEISDAYDIWLKHLRVIERLEPHDHPTLQAARRSARSVVRRKMGFGPSLESNSLKAFSFEVCRTRVKRRRGGAVGGNEANS